MSPPPSAHQPSAGIAPVTLPLQPVSNAQGTFMQVPTPPVGDSADDDGARLEQQVMLRLPPTLASRVRQLMGDQQLPPDLIALHPIGEFRRARWMVCIVTDEQFLCWGSDERNYIFQVGTEQYEG